MSGLSPQQLKTALKSLMKRQGKSYQHLADHLGLSLVSVKRIMSKEEVSVSRFLEICDWLDVKLSEVEKIAGYNQTNRKVHFTEEQETFLSEHPEYMSFLFNLYTGETPEQVQARYGLTAKSLQLYLIRLEKNNLIKKTAGRYRPVYKDFPSPILYGELARSQYKRVLEAGTHFFARYNTHMLQRKNPEMDRGGQTVFSVLEISRESYLTWFEKYKLLQQELTNTAQVEEKIETLKNQRRSAA